MEEVRINWIDIAKGVVIILMVLGHSSIPQALSYWIYSFHMPFFFFISGTLTKPYKNIDVASFIIFALNKVKSILFPFIIYSLFNILLYKFYGDDPLGDYIKHIIYDGWGGVALWFIPIYFISVIINRLCLISQLSVVITLILLITLGVCLCHYDIVLPWNLSTVPIAIVYMILGSITRNIIFETTKYKTNHKISIITVTLIISILASQHNRLDLASNQILPLLPVVATSLCGIIFIIIVSTIIEKTLINSPLTFIGKHTYEVLAFSQSIILILNANFNLNFIVKYIVFSIIMLLICYIRVQFNKLTSIISLYQ